MVNHAALEAWIRASFAAAFGSEIEIAVDIDPGVPRRACVVRIDAYTPRQHAHNVWAVAQEEALAEASLPVTVWVMHKDSVR